MKQPFVLYFLTIMALPFLASCDAGNGKGHLRERGDTISLKYARNLTMVDHGTFLSAEFRNPWDTTRALQTYLLVPRDANLPADLPDGIVVRTPLERSVVYTSTHSSLIDELGSSRAINGVCDARYIHNASIARRIASGEIADCGSSMSPNIEKILMLRPEAILLSAYENSNDHNKVAQTGIPIVDCIDYMEPSPLGRAEWMRFFGRLYGQGAKADSIFAETERAYNEIKARAAGTEGRPAVLTEMIYGSTWGVPGAYSTTGVMIEDAGGRNPFDCYKKCGSAMLAPEEVLYRAKDADLWLVKYSREVPPTISDLGKDNGIYTKFRPYATGEIYGLDTDRTSYFDDAAFHPHWILAEYLELFHPETGPSELNHHYYSKLER